MACVLLSPGFWWSGPPAPLGHITYNALFDHALSTVLTMEMHKLRSYKDNVVPLHPSIVPSTSFPQYPPHPSRVKPPKVKTDMSGKQKQTLVLFISFNYILVFLNSLTTNKQHGQTSPDQPTTTASETDEDPLHSTNQLRDIGL